MKSKNVTIKDVARMADTSVSAVSRYINKSGYVSGDVSDRIKNAVAQLNYTPNKMARSLKGDALKEIMLIVPDITNPYYAKMYRNIQKIAAEHRYTVLLYDTNHSEEQELKAIEMCRNSQISGLVFCSTDKYSKVFEGLNLLNIPVVASNRYEKLFFDTLHSEGGLGIYTATKYLIELKHREIAYAGGAKDSYINRKRRGGYLNALAEAKIEVKQDFIFEMDFTMDAGYKAGLYFSGLKNKPTAVCAANDIIAMGILIAFGETGIRIPEDISLTGEDNIEIAKICRPTLTTIDNNSEFFAQKACEMLFERLNGEYAGEARIFNCPRGLIVRQSTRRFEE